MTAVAKVRCPRCEGHPGRYADRCPVCIDEGAIEPREVIEAPPRLILRGADLAHAETAIARVLRRAPWLGWSEREAFAATIARELARDRADIAGIARYARCDVETARLVVLAYVGAVEERVAKVRGHEPLRGRALMDHARRVEAALSTPLLEAAE